MNCWDTLNIEPTTSKLVIKKAYTGQLKLCNPEDKPQEFQALRKAYQAALRESRALDTSKLNAQPAIKIAAEAVPGNTSFIDAASNEDGRISRVEQLEPALHALYSDVARRGSLEAWQIFFSETVFWNVDINKQVKETCIAFFAENPLLPRDVLHYVDHCLNFSPEYTAWSKSRVAEQAKYFVTTLNTAHLRFDYTPLDKYTGSFEVLQQHLVLRRSIEDECIFNEAELSKLDNLLAQRHADFLADVKLDEFIARQYRAQGRADVARERLSKLVEQHPDAQNQQMLADLLLNDNEVSQAHTLYRAVLAMEPENIAALKGNAVCFYREKQYDVAINLLEELCKDAFDDIQLKTTLTMARVEHLKFLREHESADNLAERARLLLALGRNQECYNLVGEVPEATKGLKRLFSSAKPESESIRLIRAAAVVGLDYKPHAIELYGAVINDRIARNENAVDVLKEMLIECAYQMVHEDVQDYVLPNLESLEQAAQANTLVDSEYWIAVALAHYKVVRTVVLDDEQYKGHASAVLEASNRAIEIEPHQAFYHLTRGYILFKLGYYEQSIISDEIASKSYLYDIVLQKRIGDTYRQLKNYKLSLEAYGFAMSYAPDPDDQRDVNLRYAYVYHEMGDFENAIKHFLMYRELCEERYLEDSFYFARLHYEYDKQRFDGVQYSEEAKAASMDAIDECAQYNTYHRENQELVATFEQAIEIARLSFPDQLDDLQTRFNALA